LNYFEKPTGFIESSVINPSIVPKGSVKLIDIKKVEWPDTVDKPKVKDKELKIFFRTEDLLRYSKLGI
jgi:hypothetical protein